MSIQKNQLEIRGASPADSPEIADIYNHYIRQAVVTFEEEAVSADIIAARIQEVQSYQLPWLAAELDGRIIGYAYASKWHGRYAYRFSTETTVYVSPAHIGQGIGYKLYSELLSALKSKGIHAAIGGIALPNPASVGLHEKMGFVKVAHFKEVGFKFERWIDVGYWQCIL